MLGITSLICLVAAAGLFAVAAFGTRGVTSVNLLAGGMLLTLIGALLERIPT